MILFLDRNIGERVSRALAEAGFAVQVHDSHFPQKTPDPEWIRDVSLRGWTILTQDRSIMHDPLARAALIATNAACFLLTLANASMPIVVALLEQVWNEIERLSREEPRPFVYLIHSTGIFERRPLNP